jgi:hypothetical protein
MRKSGLYRIEEIRPVRELFLDARWMLGRMLRKMMRRPDGQRRGSEARAVPQFKAELDRLGLTKPRAIEAQRISTRLFLSATNCFCLFFWHFFATTLSMYFFDRSRARVLELFSFGYTPPY